jgi:hypothetical protein
VTRLRSDELRRGKGVSRLRLKATARQGSEHKKDVKDHPPSLLRSMARQGGRRSEFATFTDFSPRIFSVKRGEELTGTQDTGGRCLGEMVDWGALVKHSFGFHGIEISLQDDLPDLWGPENGISALLRQAGQAVDRMEEGKKIGDTYWTCWTT